MLISHIPPKIKTVLIVIIQFLSQKAAITNYHALKFPLKAKEVKTTNKSALLCKTAKCRLV